MRILISILLAGLAFSCAVPPARSQSNSLVVAVCGTLPLAYAPGAVRADTIDVNGNKCTAGTVTISGGATAANQVLQIAQETAINTLLGVQADAACATDNGTCTLAALVKRLNQRLTTLNTTLGSPFQAGGSIGNTRFTANAGTNLNTSALALDTSVGTTNTNLGAPGATACATDTGSCSVNALTQRLAQRLTTINTTLGTPMQATGGTVGLVAGVAEIGNVKNSGTFAVQATLTAETTKVIGTVNQGTSPWVISGAVTNAGTFATQTTLPTTPTIAAGNGVVPSTSSEAGAATTAASGTAAASNLVLKSGAGNLYDLTVTLGATSGYVMLFDATALPSNGAVTPVWCAAVTSNGTNGGISASWPAPKRFGTGITAGFSTTGCFTLTASATANFFGDYK